MTLMAMPQFAEFVAVVVQQLPRDLETEEAQAWITNRQALARALRHALVPPRDLMVEEAPTVPPDTREPYPADGVVFELTLNGDAVDPCRMPRRDGYGVGWSYVGNKLLAGMFVRRFKLVSIDACHTFDELVTKLRRHGSIPEGQWREPFKDRFRSEGKGPIGIADASWRDPRDNASFPYVYGYGSHFGLIAGGFAAGWRWIVEVASE